MAKKKKNKSTYPSSIKQDEKERFLSNLKTLDDNDFLDEVDIENCKLIYSKDFYVTMAKLLKNGSTPLEAYEALGFSVELFGENRAYQAAHKAKELAKKENYGISPSDYDGSIERSKMGDLSPEEEAAYLKARVMYLEKMIEFQKKIPSLLADMNISLKPKN